MGSRRCILVVYHQLKVMTRMATCRRACFVYSCSLWGDDQEDEERAWGLMGARRTVFDGLGLRLRASTCV